ncbi:hypothetical protein ILYODFUR_034376, partial [Ilyodon furcidens]
ILNLYFSQLNYQIAGFINAIHPFSGDKENLAAFRFYALNPIVDPWVFIICPCCIALSGDLQFN